MKLIYCEKCGDIFNLRKKTKSCSCGETSGKYINNIIAEIHGDCLPIGIANNIFKIAKVIQKNADDKELEKNCRLEAFFISKYSKNIIKK